MAESIKKQNGVLWLDKTGLSLYLEDKPFIRLNFTPDIVSDLEIIDKIKLGNLLHTFIGQNKLGDISLILILTSDVLFEKDWTLPQTDLQLKEEADFIDNVPFENTVTHSWTKESKKKLVAANQDFITVLKESFEKDNGHLMAAFPYSLFGANVRNESVREIWKKLDSLKHDNLMAKDLSLNKEKVFPEEQKKTAGKSPLMPILVVVFVVLIGVLGFLMLRK